MKNSLLTLSIVLCSAFAFAQTPSAPPTKDQIKQERAAQSEKIKAACSEEIAKTGCKEDLGHGLMKCIREFKQKNKDFKFSDSCKNVVKESREMHKERKMERKAAPGSTQPSH